MSLVISLVVRMRFAQDHCEVAATQAESPLNSSRDGNFGFIAGNTELVAVNPEAAGAVIDFKRRHAHHVERIHHPTCDYDLVIMKARGVTIDRFNASARRAC